MTVVNNNQEEIILNEEQDKEFSNGKGDEE